MNTRRHALIFFFVLFTLFAAPSAHAATRSLSLGMSGEDVRVMQNALIEKGYLAAGYATGYFGPLTNTALKKFQCAAGIICSGAAFEGYGIYGPRTRAALAGSAAPAGGATATNFEFSGWIPYWRKATGTADTIPHLGQLTSVMPFGYTMKNNGTLADTARLSEEPWTSLIAEARKHNVRIIPTVMWGDGDAIHRILSNASTRIALEDEIAKVVMDNNWDGIDIDFEAKKHETIDYFSTFLKGLYQRMGKKWVYCTVEARMPLYHRFSPGATIPPDAMDYANDYDEMNKYCDRIEIMAYDQGTIDVKLNAIREAPYAPVSDPDWAAALVSMAAGSIPKHKLILGIPTYGYEYRLTPKPEGGYTYERLWAFNPRYATDAAKTLGITPARLSSGELGFIYYPSALAKLAPPSSDESGAQTPGITSEVVIGPNEPVHFMTWSDATAIEGKVALARKLGLRGVAVFKFDGGQDPRMWEVLK